MPLIRWGDLINKSEETIVLEPGESVECQMNMTGDEIRVNDVVVPEDHAVRTGQITASGSPQALAQALTEVQLEDLKDGEQLEFLMERRQMNSIGVLELQWSTKGAYDGTPLSEAFPNVIGLEES